jgi:serine/threonine protein kinase
MSVDAERDPVEELAADFMERQRRGERPSIEEYTARHPELAAEIRELFPTIAALEGWKLAQAPRSAPAGGDHPAYLGDYRIIREIGRGGMGVVYEAEQESLGRRVAVKVLPEQALGDARKLRRFEREARTAARLHHTNIVPVFGVGAQDGLHYYVMQLIRGVSLDAVIHALRHDTADGGPSPTAFSARQAAQALCSGSFAGATQVPSSDPPGGSSTQVVVRPAPSSGEEPAETPAPPQPAMPLTRFPRRYWVSVARLGLQVADALDYAQSQHVLHRDIKPANLLLDATGNVWVADFGLAKALEQNDLSNPGDVIGTPQYMAPELFAGKYDARSDLCGLGLVLYELLTLRPAYEDSTRFRLFRKITEEEPAPPRRLNPAVPRDLETVVLKAIARDPGRRYQSARELHDDLQRFVEDRPVQARRTGSVARLGRWCRRNPAVATLSAVALSLLLAVAVVATAGYVRTSTALADVTEQRKRADDALAAEVKERKRADDALAAEKKERKRADDSLAAETKERKRADDALGAEKKERKRAEATSQLALEVLDQIFERLAPDRIVSASRLTFAASADEEVEVAAQPSLTPETAVLLEKLLAFYDRLAEQAQNDTKVRLRAARANRRVGDIHLLLAQTEQALEAYRRAAGLYTDLAKESADAALVTELAGVHNAVGQAHRQDNHPERARDAYLTALKILTAASAGAEPSPAVSYEMARTCLYLGKLARETAPPPGGGKDKGKDKGKGKGGPGPKGDAGAAARAEAEQYLGKAVESLKRLVKDQPGAPAYRHLLALCLREKSALAPGPGPAGSDRKEAIDLLQGLAKQHPHVPEYRLDLCEILAQLDVRGPPRPPAGPMPVAPVPEDDYLEALRLAKELVAEHPNVPAYQLSRAQIHDRLAWVQRQNHDLPAAEKNLRQAVQVQNTLAQRFPDSTFHQLQKARFQDNLADVLLEQKKWEDGRQVLEASIKHLTKVVGKDEGLRWLNHVLADRYGKLARALRALEEPELAADAERHARELRPPPKGPGKDREK